MYILYDLKSMNAFTSNKFSYNFSSSCICCQMSYFVYVLQYGVGLDAGSSHTQLYVYRWPVPKDNGTGIVAEVLMCPNNNSELFLFVTL